ncbi:MAG: 4-hydroxy-3-methylbut-2-enyl diphosphate reductase [Dehalococcoidia bacterium]|jgi:4-hydroxy-3-methylbut-2-enyl diphosphate reductase|nr:4-hydroxy-3-methylbut-2-enyl diphosphate reductase [Dehalococcoidia bacterium]
MEIERASEMGFCFGVRRAIELVEKAVGERGPLQTLGALVHNRQVVDRLELCGVSVAASLDELQGNIVAIASHGVGPEGMEQVRIRGFEVIDATCPFVRKAQVVAKRLGKAGFWVLVFGDAAHPEVRGVLGWAGENASASLEVPHLDKLPRRLGILCQTTQNQERFAEFVAGVISHKSAKFTELRIFNTICDATSKHQVAALALAGRVDLMFVVGGQDSANTKRLARICADTGVPTYHIEAAAEVDPRWLRGHYRVGVTAGASTPDEVIDEVVRALEEV